jgi:hypothetical protein
MLYVSTIWIYVLFTNSPRISSNTDVIQLNLDIVKYLIHCTNIVQRTIFVIFVLVSCTRTYTIFQIKKVLA